MARENTKEIEVTLGYADGRKEVRVVPLKGNREERGAQPYFEIGTEYYYWPKGHGGRGKREGVDYPVLYRPAPSRCEYVTLTALAVRPKGREVVPRTTLDQDSVSQGPTE